MDEAVKYVAITKKRRFQFLCEECHGVSEYHYLNKPAKQSINCNINKNYRSLTSEEGHWFTASKPSGEHLPSLLNKPPDIRDLFKLLKTKSCHWDDMAGELHVDFNFRQEVMKEGTISNSDNKLEKVLQKWNTAETSDITWGNIISMLHNLGFIDVKKEVIRHLQKDEVVQHYSSKKDYETVKTE